MASERSDLCKRFAGVCTFGDSEAIRVTTTITTMYAIDSL